MFVRELMTASVVTISADASLRRAAGRMLSADVGSLVVIHDDTPSGIVTRTDVIEAGYRTERPFGEIPVRRAASGPLVTIEGSATISRALRKMKESDIKHLPVVEDLDVVGILTVDDVVAAYSDIRKEAQRLVEGVQGPRLQD